MAATFALPGDFGYIILTAIASIFMLMWKGFKVGAARKKYEVPYPKMYSDNDDRFNCVQRAHQNTLENYPTFLVLLIFGGLTFPKLSAAAGGVWIVGRVFYALGYYSGDPQKRMRGAFGYLGLLSLLIFSIITAIQLLGWVNLVFKESSGEKTRIEEKVLEYMEIEHNQRILYKKQEHDLKMKILRIKGEILAKKVTRDDSNKSNTDLFVYMSASDTVLNDY